MDLFIVHSVAVVSTQQEATAPWLSDARLDDKLLSFENS